MFKTSMKALALGVVVLGAAASAYACGDDKKDNAQASYTSSGSCAGKAEASKAVATNAEATKATKEACAAKMAAGLCKSKTSATLAGADHCVKDAKDAVYSENAVTYAGACPAGQDADFSFAISGAECKGTGAAAAKAIKSVKGVASVTVDYDKHMAYVCADKRTANKKAIEKSLKNAGFEDVKFVSASKENCAKSHGKIDA